MSIAAELIDLRRSSASETKNMEFKEAATQYDTRKLCRYCANQTARWAARRVGAGVPVC